jgi:tetratricopeptide (TPR) repeat protein
VPGGLTLLAVAVAAVALVVVQARQNYEAGLHDLLAGRYGAAVAQLHRATVLGQPYADSRRLIAQATTLARESAADRAILAGDPPTSQASLTLHQAAALFATGDYGAALDRVRGLPLRLPSHVAARFATSDSAVAGLLLLVSAERLLAAGDWRTAGTDASLVLARYPRCGPASALAAKAARRGRAAPLFARAAALAGERHWVLARRALRRALAVDPTYPGVAALLRRVEHAITARAAAAAAAAAAASSSSSTAGATTTTPPATSAPPPP